jgi:hypothetical protein
MRMFNRWKSAVGLCLGLSLWIMITFWLFFPYQPMTIHSIEVVNPGKVVIAGGNLLYEVTYTKTDTYPVTHLTRQLIDGYILTLAPVRGTSLPLGENQKIIVPVNIPASSYPGIYFLHLSATYQVNHLRTITVSADSDKFEIKKRAGDGRVG